MHKPFLSNICTLMCAMLLAAWPIGTAQTPSYITHTTRILSSTWGGIDIHMQLPWVESVHGGSSDVVLTINQAIHNVIVVPFTPGDFMPGAGMVEISYTITHVCNAVLSIHFHGFRGGVMGTGDIQKGMTFDLATGHMLTLGDLFAYDEVQRIVYDITSERATITDDVFNTHPPARAMVLAHAAEHFSQMLASGDMKTDLHGFYIRGEMVGLISPPLPSFRQFHVIEVATAFTDTWAFWPPARLWQTHTTGEYFVFLSGCGTAYAPRLVPAAYGQPPAVQKGPPHSRDQSQ